MTDWSLMRATVTGALDAAVAAGLANLIVGDNSIVVGKLLKSSRTMRERTTANRWAIGELADCVAEWKAAKGWATRAEITRDGGLVSAEQKSGPPPTARPQGRLL